MGKATQIKGLLAGLLVAVSLGATAQTRSAPSGAVTVSVVGGEIRVSSTGVKIASTTTALSWQLATEGYRFTSGSIDFGAAQAYFACSTFNYGQTIRCTKSASAPTGTLPYVIRLSDGQSLLELPQPSVFIQND